MSLQTPYIPQRGLSRISSLAKPKTHSVGNRDQMKCLQGLIRWMRQKGVGIYICKSECASIACFSAILNLSREKFENESPGMSLEKASFGSKLKFCCLPEIYVSILCRNITPPLCELRANILDFCPWPWHAPSRNEENLKKLVAAYRIAQGALIYRERPLTKEATWY